MSSASPSAGHAKNVIRPLETWPGHTWSGVKYHPGQKQPFTHTMSMLWYLWSGAGLWLSVRMSRVSKKPRQQHSPKLWVVFALWNISFHFPGNGRLYWGAGQFNIVQILGGKLALISPLLPWPVALCVTLGPVTTLTLRPGHREKRKLAEILLFLLSILYIHNCLVSPVQSVEVFIIN